MQGAFYSMYINTQNTFKDFFLNTQTHKTAKFAVYLCLHWRHKYTVSTGDTNGRTLSKQNQPTVPAHHSKNKVTHLSGRNSASAPLSDRTTDSAAGRKGALKQVLAALSVSFLAFSVLLSRGEVLLLSMQMEHLMQSHLFVFA